VLLLQSRLNEAIRQELGGTYSITATSEAAKYPKPEYRIRIDWTCDPARVDALVQRVFEEVRFVRTTLLLPDQMSRVRDALLREHDDNSQENGYVLNRIARKYEDNEADTVDVALQPRTLIGSLSGYAVQLASMRYLNPENFVRVTLVPEGR
jgi:zinc protease